MLDKTGLKNRIITELEGLGFEQGSYSWFDKLAQALANAVIDEIQTNCEVTSNGNHSHPAGTVK